MDALSDDEDNTPPQKAPTATTPVWNTNNRSIPVISANSIKIEERVAGQTGQTIVSPIIKSETNDVKAENEHTKHIPNQVLIEKMKAKTAGNGQQNLPNVSQIAPIRAEPKPQNIQPIQANYPPASLEESTQFEVSTNLNEQEDDIVRVSGIDINEASTITKLGNLLKLPETHRKRKLETRVISERTISNIMDTVLKSSDRQFWGFKTLEPGAKQYLIDSAQNMLIDFLQKFSETFGNQPITKHSLEEYARIKRKIFTSSEDLEFTIHPERFDI